MEELLNNSEARIYLDMPVERQTKQTQIDYVNSVKRLNSLCQCKAT